MDCEVDYKMNSLFEYTKEMLISVFGGFFDTGGMGAGVLDLFAFLVLLMFFVSFFVVAFRIFRIIVGKLL